MKLLICTQAVDTQDSDLGFFVRWIEEFAKHCEVVIVICLRDGSYTLPSNVKVYTIGKSVGSVQKAWSLISLAWKLRNEYNEVFVHMNPEYVVVAGILWRLMHRKIVLWYTHKSVDIKLRLAVLLSDVVLTASKESFRLKTNKLRVMGHGIDTDFFTPDTNVMRSDTMLSVGRLSKSKRHDLAIQISVNEGKELCIAGEGPEREHLETVARGVGANVHFLGALTKEQLRDEYRKDRCLIHTSETGSLDKVVLEALACGLSVRTNNPALKHLESANPEYIREHHSLVRLIPNILGILHGI